MVFLPGIVVYSRQVAYVWKRTPTGSLMRQRSLNGKEVPALDEHHLVWLVSEVGAKVDSRVPATGTNTLDPGRWEFGFRWIEVACHPNIANLRVLKFSLAVRALKDPFRHAHQPRAVLVGC